MNRPIKNSSGKIIGQTTITNDSLIIDNRTKPLLKITNIQLIQAVKNGDRSNNIIQCFYDEYFLGCGEIASLYDVCYSNMNRQLRTLSLQTTARQGRRNRSYGKTPIDETKAKISTSVKKAYEDGRLVVNAYERTPEIRKKISQSLKTYFQEHPQNPEPHRQNWLNGVYDNVDFHTGIGGHFFSIKNNKLINFRSLLELSYMLQLEKDTTINNYVYEPFHVRCEDGRIYTPDLLINNIVIELKSKNYLNKVGGSILKNFLYKKEQGQIFCQNNGYEYKVIFDEDIGFNSAQFKRFIASHPEIVKKYQIYFHQPERMVIK